MDTISIILPTYKRYNLLRECLSGIYVNKSDKYNLQIVAVVDDDFESIGVFFEKEKTSGLGINHRCLVANEKTGHHRAWNVGMKIATGNLFVHMGDDGLLYPGALELAYNAHKEKLNGYGMVAFNDLNLDGNTQVGTHVLFDRQFCKDHLGGVMVVPHYKGYWVDVEFNERAKGVGRYYWCKEAILEHRHSSNRKRELSEGELERTEYWEHDERLFNERKAAGFPNDFEPVI